MEGPQVDEAASHPQISTARFSRQDLSSLPPPSPVYAFSATAGFSPSQFWVFALILAHLVNVIPLALETFQVRADDCPLCRATLHGSFSAQLLDCGLGPGYFFDIL
ncbi:hypothetical protein FRC08_001122 [Ceratobasidium sp. 394]|nr:hypothetical protein FRC08_001122 [Ceratobasidium sp. 394]